MIPIYANYIVFTYNIPININSVLEGHREVSKNKYHKRAIMTVASDNKDVS